MCICVWGISESLNLLASKTFFFYRKIQLYSEVQIHRDNFQSNVKQPANYGVNTKRIATLLFPFLHGRSSKKCCWTQCFIRRGFTHAFLIRIIFHRDLSPLTSERPVLLEMYQLGLSPELVFLCTNLDLVIHKVVFFLKRKKIP